MKKIIKNKLLALAMVLSFAASANKDLPTAPVPLSEEIEQALIGKAIDYNDLTLKGSENYKSQIIYMNEGKWNYLKDSNNTLIATDKLNNVGIVKVHYSFKSEKVLERYRKALSERYSEFEKDIENSDQITIFYREPFNIDYTTYRRYLHSVINQAEKELSSNRLRFEDKVLFVEIDPNDRTSIETYMDFKIAPQWPESKIVNHKRNLNNIIDAMNKELKNTPPNILDSKAHMEKALQSNNIHIFK